MRDEEEEEERQKKRQTNGRVKWVIGQRMGKGRARQRREKTVTSQSEYGNLPILCDRRD